MYIWASQEALVVKNSPTNVGDRRHAGWLDPWVRNPLLIVGNGNPLQYSCLENPIDRGTWQAAVHMVAQSWVLLK